MVVVWGGGTVGELGEVVDRLEQEARGEQEVVVVPLLQHALDMAVAGDRVVVCSAGEHRVEGLGGLEQGGALVGRAPGPVVVAPADTQGEFLVLREGR